MQAPAQSQQLARRARTLRRAGGDMYSRSRRPQAADAAADSGQQRLSVGRRPRLLRAASVDIAHAVADHERRPGAQLELLLLHARGLKCGAAGGQAAATAVDGRAAHAA